MCTPAVTVGNGHAKSIFNRHQSPENTRTPLTVVLKLPLQAQDAVVHVVTRPPQVLDLGNGALRAQNDNVGSLRMVSQIARCRCLVSDALQGQKIEVSLGLKSW